MGTRFPFVGGLVLLAASACAEVVLDHYCGISGELCPDSDFSDSHLYVSPSSTQVPVQLQLDVRTHVLLNGSDVIYVRLPRHTSGGGGKEPGLNIPRGELVVSPSVYFEARWHEGDFNSISDPFPNSTLVLYVKEHVRIPAETDLKLRVYKSNGLMVYCGFEDVLETDDGFVMATNATAGSGYPHHIEKSDTVGNGCSAQSDCAGKGTCDFCRERCVCYAGHGSSDNMRQIGSVDCSLLECPVGPAWANMPRSPTDGGRKEHVMCSNAGECMADLGECACYVGFTGEACGRRVCANLGCNGHGQCLTNHMLAMQSDAFPLSRYESAYGANLETRTTTAWDADVVQGCLCDSAWPVGLGAGETQVAEWFGADCSRRRCPAGRDPSTRFNRADCANKTTIDGLGVGGENNLCHSECSHRGTCDYASGKCACYPGYDGEACDRLIGYAAVVG